MSVDCLSFINCEHYDLKVLSWVQPESIFFFRVVSVVGLLLNSSSLLELPDFLDDSDPDLDVLDPDLENTGDEGGTLSFFLTGVTSSETLESENTFFIMRVFFNLDWAFSCAWTSLIISTLS